MRPEITALLRPPNYSLKARLGALEARPFPIQLVDTTKKTHFVIYEASWSGTRDYGGPTSGVPVMVKCQADAYHNLAMHLNNVWGNEYPSLKNPLNIADADRTKAPPPSCSEP